MPTLHPGEEILHYRIVERLGRGGMGEVYRADDLKLLRPVAIKVLSLEVTKDPAVRRRLLREARAISALNCSKIVTIYSVEESEGTEFIVMEYVEGRCLREMIKEGPMEFALVVDLGSQIADALDVVHPLGLIHRDVKPANIMITPRWQVKLLDFGLAKKMPTFLEKDHSTEHNELTRTGAIVGTIAYMSPEQARGEELDGRSDIFSLGCLLYEACTGRLPFEARSPVEVFSKLLTYDPPPPSSLRRGIPLEFDFIIQSALAKEKEVRLGSASDFAMALRAVSKAAESEICTVTGESNLQLRENQNLNSIAVLPFVNVSGNQQMEFLSDGITESLLNSLSRLPGLRVVPRTSVFRFKGTDLEPQDVGLQLNVRAVLTGRVMQREKALNIQTELTDVTRNAQLWGEQYNRSLCDILTVQEEIARGISRNLRIKLTGNDEKRLPKRYTNDADAYCDYLQGLFYSNRRSEAGLRKGIDHFNHSLHKDSGYALAHAGLADCYNLLGVYGFLHPRQAFPAAKAAAIRALQLEESLAEAHVSLASVACNYEWNWVLAESEFNRAIELNSSCPVAHQWYADLLTFLKRWDEAISEIGCALDLDPVSTVIRTALGRQYYYRRDYDQAIFQYKKTIEMDPQFGLAHFALGFAYKQQSMFKEAILELEKSVFLSSNDPGMLAGLGHVHALEGREDEAKRILNRLEKISRARYVTPFGFALIYAGLGDYGQAMSSLEQCYQDRSVWLLGLGVEPSFDGMRNNSQFQNLLGRMGLVQSEPVSDDEMP